MKRAGLLAGLAALILLALLGYLWWSRPDPSAPVTAMVAPETTVTQSESAAPAPAPVPSQAAPAEQAAPSAKPAEAPAQPSAEQVARISPKDTVQPEPAAPPAASKPDVKTRTVAPPRQSGPAAILPSFDVVRVEPSGEAVLAGRATPGSAVKLLDGNQAIAEVEADPNGQWVIVLQVPLAPGSHELSLESRLATGEILLSENVVVVSVPAPALVAEAPAPAAAPESEAPAASTPTAPDTPDAVTMVKEQAAALGRAGAESLRPFAVLMPRDGQGPIRVIQSPEPVASGLGAEALLLETVDYDREGRAVIGGRGLAGVLLIVYLDRRPAGRTLIGTDGRWQVRLDGEVPFGVHVLRVDQIDSSGRVAARVESPFSRAEIMTAMADETAVIVQPGNSLWRIARRVYGEGVRYSVIYQANRNQIGDPDLIYPGQIFVVPTTN